MPLVHETDPEMSAREPEPHRLNLSVLLEVASDVDAATLEQAIDALTRHHDALRLRFSRQGGEWQAEIAPLHAASRANLGSGRAERRS